MVCQLHYKLLLLTRVQPARREEPAVVHHLGHHHLGLQRLCFRPHLLHDLLPQVFKQLVMRKLKNPRINYRFIKPFLTTWCLGLQTAYFSPTFETLLYTERKIFISESISHTTPEWQRLGQKMVLHLKGKMALHLMKWFNALLSAAIASHSSFCIKRRFIIFQILGCWKCNKHDQKKIMFFRGMMMMVIKKIWLKWFLILSNTSPIIALPCTSVHRLVEFVEFTQPLLELANHQKQFHLTLLGLVILVIQISRPLPNKTKTKFDQDFRWSPLKNSTKFSKTQCLGSVVPLAMSSHLLEW